MRKVFLLALIALVAGGCASHGPVNVTPGNPQRRVFMYQVGVVVHVVNNCAPLLDLERAGRIEIKDLPYGESAVVPLISVPFSGSGRRMFLTAKGYTAKYEYLGSTTRTFSVSTYQGSSEDVWEIDHLRLPNGRGGCV